MPNYTLNYFNGRGRAELTRLIFAASGTKFTDDRVEFAEWPAKKANSPIGQMPYLQVDDVVLPQSIAIARFVAKETNLAGRNNLEQAQADAIVDTIIDLVNYFYSKIFGIKDALEQETAFKAFLADQGAKAAESVEKLITLYGSDVYSVGTGLTWADLLIFDVGSAVLSKVADFASKYPRTAAVHANVANHERVAEYVKNRPVTPF